MKKGQPARIDHRFVGKVFGLLTVIGRKPKSMVRVRWICRCECGKLVDVRSDVLTRGKQKSCGCLRWKRFRGG